MSHKVWTRQLPRCKESKAILKPKDAEAGQVKSRLVTWRFVLQAGVDLAEHCMLLVFDNSHKGHCSLVRMKPTDKANRKWVPTDLSYLDGPFLPQDAADACQEFMDDGVVRDRDQNGFDSVLKSAFACTPDGEPEVFFERALGGNMVRTFPKLASHFTLFDIRMEATAEPRPPQNHPKNPQLKLYHAVVVLYYINCDSDIQHLIQSLEDVDYDAEKLSCMQRSMLVDAMELAANSLDTEDESWSEQYNRLMEGLDVVYEL